MSSSVSPAVTLSPPQEDLPRLAVDRLVHVFHPKVRTGVPMLRFWTAEVGIPLGLVLDACYVVAGNVEGKLYTYTEPRQQISEVDTDALLHAGDYVFVVLGLEEVELEDYGVCPSFRAWTPPTPIPDRWKGSKVVLEEGAAQSSDISAAVKQADGCCVLTRSISGLESSHLIPKAEDAWFTVHYIRLQSYGGDARNDLNSMRNQIALRADLNAQGFDAGQFVLAPYAGKITALFLQTTYRDLARKHHLQQVPFPTRIIRGYLFSRFAWSIFGFHADLQAIYEKVGPAAGVIDALEAVEARQEELKQNRKRKASLLHGRKAKKPKASGKAEQDEDGRDDTDQDGKDGNGDAGMGSARGSDEDDAPGGKQSQRSDTEQGQRGNARQGRGGKTVQRGGVQEVGDDGGAPTENGEDSEDDKDIEDDEDSAHTYHEELESKGRPPTEDGMAPRINDPTLQNLLEDQDKALKAKNYLTEDDVAAGRYVGFSDINRVALKWVADHPQISAVRNPHRMARV